MLNAASLCMPLPFNAEFILKAIFLHIVCTNVNPVNNYVTVVVILSLLYFKHDDFCNVDSTCKRIQVQSDVLSYTIS